MKYLVLIFVVFCTGTHTAIAQKTIHLELFDMEDGLSSSNINSVFQDYDGFIWLSSENGINRFDGLRFKAYWHSSRSGILLKARDKIFQDRKGNLWMDYVHRGFLIYNKAKDNFDVLTFDTLDHVRPGKCQINTVFIDSKNDVWIGTDNGIIAYNDTKSKFDNIIHSLILKNTNISAIEEDTLGNLWFGTSKGLYILERRNNTLYSYFEDPLDPSTLSANNIYSIVKDHSGNMWVGTMWGLNKVASHTMLNLKKLSFERIIPFEDKTNSPLSKIRKIIPHSSGDLWLYTDGGLVRVTSPLSPIRKFYLHLSRERREDKGSLNYFEPKINKNGDIVTMNQDAAGHFFTYSYAHNVWDTVHYQVKGVDRDLKEIKVNSFYIDDSNILWMVLEKKGVVLYDFGSKAFHRDLIDHDVFGIYRNAEALYVGSRQHLNILKKGDKWVRLSPSNHPQMPYSFPGTIRGFTKGKLWIGFWDGLMSRYDIAKNTFENFQYIHQDPHALHAWSVRDIHQDANGTLWIAGTKNGLAKWDPDTKKFYYLQASPAISYNSIWLHHIYQDLSGILWMGSRNQGLYRFDTTTEKFQQFVHIPGAANTLPENEIRHVHEESPGILWISTGGGGLCRFDTKKHKFRTYTVNDGLPSNTLQGALSDGRGNLWISTSFGLSRFNIQRESFQNFYESDGLTGHDFNMGAFFRDKEGYMYFGTTKGLVWFHPDSISTNKYPPKIALTSMYLFNEEVLADTIYDGEIVLRQHINEASVVQLNHHHKMLTFEFAALHYANPWNIKYKYKLEGFDKNWNTTNSKNTTATYTNLPPGSYKLLIKSTNSDGIWSENVKELTILVRAAWYNTWWFKIVVLVLVVFIVAFSYRWRLRFLKHQKTKLKQLVRLKTEELKKANKNLSKQKDEIERKRNKIKSQYNTILTITDIGLKVTSSVRAKDIVKKVHDSVDELMKADEFAIGFLNDRKEKLVFWTFIKYSEEVTTDEIDVSDPHRISAWCIRNKKELFLNDVENEFKSDDAARVYDNAVKPGSSMYVPTYTQKKEISGIIIVKSYAKSSYSHIDLNILRNIANYTAIAFENANIYNELERQSEQLKLADSLKTRFFINISHELLTPLTLIISPLKHLMKVAGHKHDMQHLEIMNRNASRLLLLINQLLDIRKLESGNMQLNLVGSDIVYFIERVAAAFSEGVALKSIDFKFETDSDNFYLIFDNDIVEKILYNLLSNAVKFTPAGGFIRLTFKVLKHTCQIVVANSGEGIPEERLGNIFQRFYHFDPHNNGGYGIGLSYVKDLVELHGGSIYVNSTPGEHTHFEVTLPRKMADNFPEHFKTLNPTMEEYGFSINEVPVYEEKIPETEVDCPVILIAEDNIDLQKYLTYELSADYYVMNAYSGKEAIEKVNRFIPDIILCDIMMPEINGFELCKAIKSSYQTSHIPVVVLTAKTSDTDQIEGLETGADDYIMKPFDIDVLKAKLESIIANRKRIYSKVEVSLLNGHAIDTGNKMDREFIEKCKNLVEHNLFNDDFNYDIFYDALNMSKSNCYRKIKAITGKSTSELILSFRMKAAAELLSSKKYQITELAYLMGYNNTSNFSRDFKKILNVSPSKITGIR